MFWILAVCNYEIHLAAVTLLRDPFTQSSVPPRPPYISTTRLTPDISRSVEGAPPIVGS
jgi:hypothetical protein